MLADECSELPRRHASSIYTAQHLLNIDPKNALLRHLGWLFAIGQYEKALEVIDRILKIHPKDSRTQQQRVCLERLFRIEEASNL